tara:strand:+ start:237 stop:410 length:174 start_codon:yes stop_codon:yes gene_type:complete
MSGCSSWKLSIATKTPMMAARLQGVSTGFEPNWKNAGQKNASSGLTHKKSPLTGLDS